jgi:tetratricopeptide (TPR) repeat protein
MAYVLTTFGGCRLVDDLGQPVRCPALGLILLAYLCEAGQPVPRRELAGLLWPGNPHAAATNLRSMLRRMQQATQGTGSLPVLQIDHQTVSINCASLACHLNLANTVEPLARLKALSDAVAMQFLPAEGKGNTAIDVWVRHVRGKRAADLRNCFIALAQDASGANVRAELKRAAILLLEWDPHDEEVRRLIAEPPPSVPAQAASPLAIRQPVQPSEHQPWIINWTPPRLALLPPDTAQSAAEAGSVANALIEDLTIDLCSSRMVSVVAPYTSERIRASGDKAAMLERHRVIYALDTQRSGDRLFVQLIFMPTDEVLWATRFELNPHEITRQRQEMAAAIRGTITHMVSAQASLADQFGQKPEAYFAYLRGVQSLSDLTLPAVRKARRHFREALTHDRGLGLAMAGISRTLSLEWLFTARGDADLLTQAERLALQAIDSDRSSAGAFKELGVSQLYLGQIDESLDALQKAERINPNYADVLYSHADTLVHAAQPQQALDKVLSAIEINPLAPDTYLWTAAGASFFLGSYEEALRYIAKMQDARPADRLAAACWGMLGDIARARRCRLRVLKDNPGFNLEQWLKMVPAKEDWQRQHYRDGLLKAGF